MKRLFLVLAFALLALSASAQITHASSGSVDENAQQVLKKAAAKMSGTVSFTIKVQNLDPNRKETFSATAKVLYSSPRYRVQTDELTLYCDGRNVWQWNRQAGEVTLTAMTDSDDDLTNPAKLLANYPKNYRPKFIREEEDGTAVVDLQPKKARSYHKIRLYINASTGLLKKLEAHNFDSSRGVYTLSGFKNVKCTDADFVFDSAANKGVEVIDMR